MGFVLLLFFRFLVPQDIPVPLLTDVLDNAAVLAGVQTMFGHHPAVESQQWLSQYHWVLSPFLSSNPTLGKVTPDFLKILTHRLFRDNRFSY